MLSQEALAKREALIGKLASLPPVPSALDQIVHHFGHDAVAEVTGRSRRVLRIEDAQGVRLALRPRPASAGLTETAAFMDGEKANTRLLHGGGYRAELPRRLRDPPTRSAGSTTCSSPAGGPTRRSRAWGAPTGRTRPQHPLFRPVTTDVKGERRFIATIARRLDSLGAITRGQRNSQTAMDGEATLFRAGDNLESPYARAALRQFYGALWRGGVPGWSLGRFEEATGLKLAYEGALKEDLPPMPKFLNRLLALPIEEQNALFAELESRVESNIEQAVEAGTYEVGVETLRADSLTADRQRDPLHPPRYLRGDRPRRDPPTRPARAHDGRRRARYVQEGRRAGARREHPFGTGGRPPPRALDDVRRRGRAGTGAPPAASGPGGHGEGRTRCLELARGGGSRMARPLGGRGRRPADAHRIAFLARHRAPPAGLGPSGRREHAGATGSTPTTVKR